MNLSFDYQTFTLLKTISHEKLKEHLKAGNDIKLNAYGQGQVIHFDGDTCTAIEIVLDGQVVIERIDDAGNLMRITEFFPDDILGANLLFSLNASYPMTITAKTPVTLMRIKKDLVFELCSTNKAFLKVFLEYISNHSLLLGDRLKYYVRRPLRESIIAYLKNEFKLQNTYDIKLKMTKKDLADRMGVQRTSFSRELQKMKQEGLIDYDSTHIFILDKHFFKSSKL